MDSNDKAAPMISDTAIIRPLADAICKLKPTGRSGFEGFLAAVLGSITGQDFRLATSGSQQGIDGVTAASGPKIAFEAKLYKSKLNKNDVISKISEVSLQHSTELWVLGATVEIGAQLSSTIEDLSKRLGLPVVVLDWCDIALPRLAVACAGAKVDALNFLRKNLRGKQNDALVDQAAQALDAVHQHPNFSHRLGEIVRELTGPAVGTQLALRANGAWLNESFRDKRLSKLRLGQSLTPLDDTAMPVLQRPALVDQTSDALHRCDGKIVGILGDEGCGKSWLLAQTISTWQDKPFVLVIPAREIKNTGSYENFTTFFISRIIVQTADNDNERSINRWKSRFQTWQQADKPRPNLIVWIDGLNENIGVQWSKWLDGASAELEQIGGKLAFTSRRTFYVDHIKDGLASASTMIKVPEWTDAELDCILDQKGLAPSKVTGELRRSLRNPRVLGIAFNLFASEKILDFKELTVSHLLFEYIRVLGPEEKLGENSKNFARRLTEHAKSALLKIERHESEDIAIFDVSDFAGNISFSLSGDLLHAVDGVFYRSHQGATSYELSKEGLNLALGFAVIAAMEKAERNQQDVGEKLQEILEPVAALDLTADVVFSAMLAACIDTEKSDTIRVALINQYLRLQNRDQSLYPAFAAMARVAPSATADAFHKMMIHRDEIVESEWILQALREQQSNEDNWNIIGHHIKRWLRHYSLNPALRAFPSADAEEKREALEKNSKKISETMTGLGEIERQFIENNLTRNDETDSSRLIENVFLLLAGTPLASFSDALVAWLFSSQLNASLHAPWEDFDFLIGFNTVDWAETRAALIESASVFDAPGVSIKGQWPLMNVLSAIATPAEASRVDAFRDAQFPKKMKRFRKGWRLIEKYCSTDPCDPLSNIPDNLAQAVEAITAADFSKLYVGRWVTQEQNLLGYTSTGLSRFAPAFAVETQRRAIDVILGLEQPTFKFALHDLVKSSAILNRSDVEKLLRIARQFSTEPSSEDQRRREGWVASQYAFLASQPHLSGHEQLAAIISLPPHTSLLLQVLGYFVPTDPIALEEALRSVYANGRADTRIGVLAFAHHSGTELTQSAREIVTQMAGDTDGTVRYMAIRTIMGLPDNEDLIQSVLNSGWTLKKLDRKENIFEYFYGSKLLVQAAKFGIRPLEECLLDINPELYGYAIKQLGSNAAMYISRTLNLAVTKITNASIPFIPPGAEEAVDLKKPDEFRWRSINEMEEKLSVEQSFERMNESDEEYSARQKRAQAAFNAFQRAITDQEAGLIVTNIGLSCIQGIFEVAPSLVIAWADTFLPLDGYKRGQVRNIGLAVASAISAEHPERAITLFQRLTSAHEFLHMPHGKSKIDWATMCMWRSESSPAIDAFLGHQLDSAVCNQDIATHVAAALWADKLPLLKQYVREALKSEIPALISRAITIYGFLDQDTEASEVIATYLPDKGMIGDAARMASYAYERNLWARHWFELICNTDDRQDFWRYSVLFHKVVDFRYEIWEPTFDRTGQVIQRFERTLDDGIKKRIEKWSKKRSEKLFGLKVPNALYLQRKAA